MRIALVIVGCVVLAAVGRVDAAPLDPIHRLPPAKRVAPEPTPLRADVPPPAFVRRTLPAPPYRPFRAYAPGWSDCFGYYGHRLRYSSWH